MKYKHIGTVVLGSMLLHACASNSLYGPERPIQAGNLVGRSDCNTPPPNTDPKLKFLAAHFLEKACASKAEPTVEAKSKEFLAAGYTIVSSRCNDYFAQKGGTQLGVHTALDTVAPLFALLTNVLSIVKIADVGKRKNLESVLSFSSVAATAGFSVYEKNFLFSAENIDTVRELTLSALKAHANAVNSMSGHTFDTSLQYLIEHQMYCTPGKIRDLVKGSIANARVKAVDRQTGQEISPNAALQAVQNGNQVSNVAGTNIVIKSD